MRLVFPVLLNKLSHSSYPFLQSVGRNLVSHTQYIAGLLYHDLNDPFNMPFKLLFTYIGCEIYTRDPSPQYAIGIANKF